jgi:hypothetical protein
MTNSVIIRRGGEMAGFARQFPSLYNKTHCHSERSEESHSKMLNFLGITPYFYDNFGILLFKNLLK